jgi:hypothetical protein
LAAILIDQLGAAIVDQFLHAIEGRPASINIPCEYLSLADPERLAQQLGDFAAIAA